jgi:hypothetical protein
MPGRVANVRHLTEVDLKAQAEGRFLYCGRGCYGWPASPLANIIRTEDAQAYIDWLCDRIDARDPAVWQAMRSIRKDTVLACWCAPNPCHVDLIWQVWREYACIPCRRCGDEHTFQQLVTPPKRMP